MKLSYPLQMNSTIIHSHSKPHAIFYFYIIFGVAAVVIFLLALNIVVVGCSTTLAGVVQSSRRFLSGPPKDDPISKLIPISKYKKEKSCETGEDDCSVCLTAFRNGEEVRQMPKCKHLFHAPCIDMWLYSHSNCPLCRANVLLEEGGSDGHRSPLGGTTTTDVVIEL